ALPISGLLYIPEYFSYRYYRDLNMPDVIGFGHDPHRWLNDLPRNIAKALFINLKIKISEGLQAKVGDERILQHSPATAANLCYLRSFQQGFITISQLVTVQVEKG